MMKIAFLDSNDDVIATGADNYADVAAFNTAYPDFQYTAVTRIYDCADGLKVKIADEDVKAFPKANYYHRQVVGDGKSITDYQLIEDLRGYRRYLRDKVNSTTKDIIQAGVVYPTGVDTYARFPMTDEDQRNYMGMAMSAASLTYSGEDRLKVKGISLTTGEDVYWTPDSAGEVATFFGAGLLHVKSALEAGWDIKDGIMSSSLVELDAWTDPRL
jgi:hypothetical protein